MSQPANSQASSDALAVDLARMQVDAAASAAADEEEERSLSLPAHFYRCQSLYTQLFVSSKLPRTLAACQSLQRSLESLQRRIDSAGVFSSNESAADDLATSAIKFLVAPYYLAQLHTSFPCQIAQRGQHVLAAARAFESFMRRLESYGLVHEEKEAETFRLLNKELLRKLTAPSTAVSASSRPPMPTASAWMGPGGKRLDPSAVRTAKIARVRHDKELAAQLEVLQQSRTASYRQRSAAKSANTITSASAQADEEADDELLDAGSDEEDVRAFYLLLLQRLVLSTVDATRSALDEADMLCHYRDVELRKPKNEQLEHMSPEERSRQSAGPGGAPGPKPVMHKMTPDSLNQPVPEHMKHLLQNIAQPAQSGRGGASSSSSTFNSAALLPAVSSIATSVDSLIAARAPTREQVFKLTNQPTYSIEQWADMEIAAGRMPGPADASSAPRQPDPRRIRSAADREVAEEMVAAYMATQDDSEELGHEDGAAGMAKDELKTLKDREWDNWKDDNQRGVGNSIK